MNFVPWDHCIDHFLLDAAFETFQFFNEEADDSLFNLLMEGLGFSFLV